MIIERRSLRDEAHDILAGHCPNATLLAAMEALKLRA